MRDFHLQKFCVSGLKSRKKLLTVCTRVKCRRFISESLTRAVRACRGDVKSTAPPHSGDYSCLGVKSSVAIKQTRTSNYCPSSNSTSRRPFIFHHYCLWWPCGSHLWFGQTFAQFRRGPALLANATLKASPARKSTTKTGANNRENWWLGKMKSSQPLMEFISAFSLKAFNQKIDVLFILWQF